MPTKPNLEYAVLGGGCFWCLEALYSRVPGVVGVEPGYAGGETEDPAYEQVCTGRTGHAEVVKVLFQPDHVSYPEILDRFWRFHDPTTKDRQGSDVGTQYRSIILCTGPEQQAEAERSKQQAQKSFSTPIVTEITPLVMFYPAEEYHHNYFEKNPGQGYCQVIIRPKVDKNFPSTAT